MKKRFTLIELMVIIACIAIINVIAMPPVFNARQKAKATSCQGNMRQLGMAATMYVSDSYRHPLPVMRYVGTGENPNELNGTNDSWVGFDGRQTQDKKRFLIASKGTLYKYIVDEEVYKCPADEEELSLAYAISPLTRFVHKISAIKNASSTPLFIEDGGKITKRCGLYWCDVKKGSTNSFNISKKHIGKKRHEDSLNITYMDGHVESSMQSWKEIYTACFNYKNGITITFDE